MVSPSILHFKHSSQIRFHSPGKDCQEYRPWYKKKKSTSHVISLLRPTNSEHHLPVHQMLVSSKYFTPINSSCVFHLLMSVHFHSLSLPVMFVRETCTCGVRISLFTMSNPGLAARLYYRHTVRTMQSIFTAATPALASDSCIHFMRFYHPYLHHLYLWKTVQKRCTKILQVFKHLLLRVACLTQPLICPNL